MTLKFSDFQFILLAIVQSISKYAICNMDYRRDVPFWSLKRDNKKENDKRKKSKITRNN